MVGKVYRPEKISSLKGRRGYEINGRYKSNFGGITQYIQDVYLEYDSKTGKEHLVFVFHGIKVPIKLMDKENEKFEKIETFRKLSRPVEISAKGGILRIEFDIISEKDERENDRVIFLMQMIFDNGKEYLKIETDGKTPIIYMNED